MKKEKSCGAVIFWTHNDERQFLLVQHRSGHWGFPKGHVERNEKELETALREVHEETGVEIDILPNFRRIIEYRPCVNHIKEVIYFVASYVSGEATPQESELRTLGWFEYNAALEQLTFSNDRAVLIEANKFIQNSLSCQNE